ncbi:MAG: hypothetical protein HGA70_01265 [Chlorobiaceae bacterium]|nr:hypothetical protein [Chlorobiaceae bacterium]
MIRTANFFWNGEFSLYEYTSLSSFVNNGFKVQVFTYNNISVPDGVVLRDARDILTEKLLYAYTQSGQKGCMPGFANAFRYNLLKKEGGWWFDADLVCVKKVDHFIDTVRSKHKPISAGYQNTKYVNNAVIYTEDEAFIDSILLQLEKNGKDVAWGDNGARLITNVVKDLGYQSYVDAVEKYYPVDANDLKKLFDPASHDWCCLKVKEASTIHLWNDVIGRLCIPKNVLPPVGSFLREIFVATCPEMIQYPTLPFDTVNRLFDYYFIKSENDRMKKNMVDKISDVARKILRKIRLNLRK